jgi:hypothetical protein
MSDFDGQERRLAEMSTDELIAINITSPDFNLATDELSRRRKGTVREAEESGFHPTSAERALVGQLRSDVEVERQGRHTAEDLLERAITSLRSIASADPKSDQARWMVEEAKRGFPKGAKR